MTKIVVTKCGKCPFMVSDSFHEDYCSLDSFNRGGMFQIVIRDSGVVHENCPLAVSDNVSVSLSL